MTDDQRRDVEFLVHGAGDESSNELLGDPMPRPRWYRWVVAGVVVLLGVAVGLRLASAGSSGPTSGVASASGSRSLQAVPPVVPRYPSATPDPTYSGLVPAIPGRAQRTISADKDVPKAVRAGCESYGGCQSLLRLPAATVIAVREAIPGALLAYQVTIVQRVGGNTTLVLRKLVAQMGSVVYSVVAQIPSHRVTSFDRTDAAHGSRTVQRAIEGYAIRVDVQILTGSPPLVAHLERLASDPRVLALA